MNKKARFDNLPCFSQRDIRKKGWLLILEATIAVLIISGILIVVYSQQADRGDSQEDYFYSLQGQILADVSARSDLRLNVLNVEDETSEDGNFSVLNNFIGGKIPGAFGYSIRVCDFGDVTDYCKMRTDTYIATMDKDIYVEEIIISAELGSGADAVYSPKKLRLFVWEGCVDFCSADSSLYCSVDLKEVLIKRCEDFDDDNCLEYIKEVNDTCVIDEMCKVDECVPAWAELMLEFSGVVYEFKTNVEIDGIVYPEVHYYTHNRTFTESNGVGVDLTEGELCQELLEVCDSASISYRIDESDVLIQENKQFYTTLDEETFTLKYLGVDDNGNDVYVEQSLCVDGSSFTVNC